MHALLVAGPLCLPIVMFQSSGHLYWQPGHIVLFYGSFGSRLAGCCAYASLGRSCTYYQS